MWQGLQSSEGLTGLDDPLPGCTDRAVIGALSFASRGPFHRLLKCSHDMAANVPQSKPSERE